MCQPAVCCTYCFWFKWHSLGETILLFGLESASIDASLHQIKKISFGRAVLTTPGSYPDAHQSFQLLYRYLKVIR